MLNLKNDRLFSAIILTHDLSYCLQLLEQYFKQLIEKELPECIGDLKDQLEELDATKKAKVA